MAAAMQEWRTESFPLRYTNIGRAKEGRPRDQSSWQVIE